MNMVISVSNDKRVAHVIIGSKKFEWNISTAESSRSDFLLVIHNFSVVFLVNFINLYFNSHLPPPTLFLGTSYFVSRTELHLSHDFCSEIFKSTNPSMRCPSSKEPFVILTMFSHIA